MTVTDPYTGIGVITRGVFDSDMAAISLSLHSSCNDIALNEKNSPSFCQIHFYRGIFHLLSSCTLSTLRAFNSSSFHPSSPQIHPFSMIPVTPHVFQSTHSLRSATQPTLYITTQQSKSYFAPTSLKRPSLHGYTFWVFICQSSILNALHQSPTCRGIRVSLRLAHRPCSTVFK